METRGGETARKPPVRRRGRLLARRRWRWPLRAGLRKRACPAAAREAPTGVRAAPPRAPVTGASARARHARRRGRCGALPGWRAMRRAGILTAPPATMHSMPLPTVLRLSLWSRKRTTATSSVSPTAANVSRRRVSRPLASVSATSSNSGGISRATSRPSAAKTKLPVMPATSRSVPRLARTSTSAPPPGLTGPTFRARPAGSGRAGAAARPHRHRPP